MGHQRCPPHVRSEANGIMKYIRQTVAAVATLTVMVLLAFALKATPVSSLLSDGGGGRGDQPGGPSRDNGGPGGRNASFNPSASSARPNRSCRRLQSLPQSRCSRNGVANSGLRLCEDHFQTPKGRPP